MWFVHLEAVRAFCMEQGPEEAELKELRRQLCLPKDEEVPVRPVLFIRFFVNHYFVVVVDYEEDMMFTFGRHINPDLAGVYTHNEEDWHQWQGQWLWLHLQKLFQWECFSTAPNHVLSVNWEQVGVIPAFPPFFFVLFFVITFVLTGRSFTEWARLWPCGLLSDQGTTVQWH